MPQFHATITEIATFPGQVAVRWQGAGSPKAHPGQFYLAAPVTETAPLARRALFPGRSVSEWVLPDGHALAGLAPGDTLDLLGPCGSAWQVRPDLNLLLIGAQPERLLFLAQAAVTARCAVTWWWPEAVPAWAPGLLPAAVELQRGPLTRDLARWADGVLCDVAPPDLTSLAHRLREWGGPKPAGFVQALCVPSFPCGVGACQACWVETRHGRRLACLEGPVLAIG